MKQLPQGIIFDANPGRATLPEAVCFRVTRYCNARCGFCLAPPDGSHPDADTLAQRIDWLRSRGVRAIHFCGGEPTIHPGLATLIEHVHAGGGKTLLTTNGITIQDQLISVLRRRGTRVKVSLHGDQEHHNRMVGCKAFHATTGNLHRLLAAGVPASVQTTVVSGGEWVLEWVADFCRSIGVRQLSILPFIPRGNGSLHRGEYELSSRERHSLHDLVRRKRKALAGILEIKWQDFRVRPVMVVEANGTLVLEAGTETSDQIVCRIPNTATPDMISSSQLA